ncbi:MAG TPA: carbonic anhydrase family protein [Kofleriaceae bacterium]|nr:carbonic anhydrase family protein [Kofleriaceae bacterium]
MVKRNILCAVVALAGCEQWKAPQRISELESRVDQLSAEVSALVGKPVGGGGKPKPAEAQPAEPAAGSGSANAQGSAKAAPPDPAMAAPPPVDKPAAKIAPKPVTWTYAGETGPGLWASLDPAWVACKGGQQSPIDLELHASKASPIEFAYRPSTAHVVDTGHTLQVNLEAGSKITIADAAYKLVQFHVHTPSEHTIAGERYPLELHLVHEGEDGKVAMVAVMFDVGEGAQLLEPVFAKWPSKVDAPLKLRKPFDPTALLPESRGVVQYTGSLTTPPCTEGVMWNVMRRTKTITKRQLERFQLHYPSNARPVMPRGERTLL